MATVQALGASARVKLGALGVALALPAALGGIVGLSAGLGLYSALDHSNAASTTPVLGLVVVAPATVVLAAVLAAATSHLKSRRPLTELLRAAAD